MGKMKSLVLILSLVLLTNCMNSEGETTGTSTSNPEYNQDTRTPEYNERKGDTVLHNKSNAGTDGAGEVVPQEKLKGE